MIEQAKRLRAALVEQGFKVSELRVRTDIRTVRDTGGLNPFHRYQEYGDAIGSVKSPRMAREAVAARPEILQRLADKKLSVSAIRNEAGEVRSWWISSRYNPSQEVYWIDIKNDAPINSTLA